MCERVCVYFGIKYSSCADLLILHTAYQRLGAGRMLASGIMKMNKSELGAIGKNMLKNEIDRGEKKSNKKIKHISGDFFFVLEAFRFPADPFVFFFRARMCVCVFGVREVLRRLSY